MTALQVHCRHVKLAEPPSRTASQQPTLLMMRPNPQGGLEVRQGSVAMVAAKFRLASEKVNRRKRLRDE
ncbi:MAG TPA: hypothetical protein VGZ47_07590 [Gemmataceae bacterium]|nr:hypothetical protein [Gemmataceae bacterium]